MPFGDPQGNFGTTAGYGGNFPGYGGATNMSGTAGGNPTNVSGGVGDYGLAKSIGNAIASGGWNSLNDVQKASAIKLGMAPKQAILNQDTRTSYQKAKQALPRIMPVVKVPRVLPAKPPGWTDQQYMDWIANMPGTGQPPQPGMGKIMDRIPPGGLNSWGGTIGEQPAVQQPSGGFGDVNTQTGSTADVGTSGDVMGGGLIDHSGRGLAKGGVVRPGERVRVGEKGMEHVIAGPGGAIVIPKKKYKIGGPLMRRNRYA